VLVREGEGCATCHQLGGDEDFASMERATCVECHDHQRHDSAGAACTLCHGYHLGQHTLRLPEDGGGR
jgi:hypothetical protein